MGMGTRKSMMNVSVKEPMQATLKARLSLDGSSMAISSSSISFSSSTTVGRVEFGFGLACTASASFSLSVPFSLSRESALGVVAVERVGALMRRVWSQSN